MKDETYLAGIVTSILNILILPLLPPQIKNHSKHFSRNSVFRAFFSYPMYYIRMNNALGLQRIGTEKRQVL